MLGSDEDMNSVMIAGASRVSQSFQELLELVGISGPSYLPKSGRVGRVSRDTKETSITVEVSIDGSGVSSVSSGIGFVDHMISALAKHGRFDITISCDGTNSISICL